MEHQDGIANVMDLPGAWPESDQLKAIQDSERLAIASEISPKITDLLSKPEKATTIVKELFHEDSFWRDQVAITWSLRTFYSKRYASSYKRGNITILTLRRTTA